ncbi:hypothetical protein KMZ93_01075 [Bradyrhizobium sediminis]|uniref:Uncharacterized protein n=1 Tax=Bradyrhizobium sediminis TaxID=2840469 RepID=A0A975RWW0_9BRAD|nr:hypothetical protein [Bradyrhizobium sediminis]QWG23577.1 hypothetical protein KMZ93_01075 [Bradyrhizobium sediminis]
MLNAGFAAASVLALLTFTVHTFVGGVYVVRPLLAVEGLSRASRWLNYYCWHMTTLTLLVMTAMFAYSALEPAARGFGVLFTALAASFSLLCIAVAIKGGVRPWRFPATGLFAAVAAAGIWGLST